jgi:hypothetical protein
MALFSIACAALLYRGYSFLNGVVVALCVVAAIHFVGFYRQTRDKLLLPR